MRLPLRAIVPAVIQVLSVDERCLHIRPFADLAPGNEIVGPFLSLKRDVAGRAQPDRIDERHAAVGVGNESQIIRYDRRWHRDIPAPGELPQFPAPDASSCAVTGAKSATRSKMEVECFNIGPLTSALSRRALR